MRLLSRNVGLSPVVIVVNLPMLFHGSHRAFGPFDFTLHSGVVGGWRRGAVGRVSDLRSRGHGFESRPGMRRKNSGHVSHTYVPLFTKQYKLLPAKGFLPCGWGVKAGMVCVWVAGKTV